MAGRQFKFHDGESGTALAVRIKHSKKASEFSNILRDGTIVIRLERKEGDVNQNLVNFLAKELNIPKNKFQIVAGAEGDKKLVSVIDLQPKLIQKKILDRIP